MKLKQAFRIRKILRYLCICCVIVIGFASIIGTGGGGDDGGVVIDNSPFWGDYAQSATIDSCEIVANTITIGGDLNRKDEDNYIYVPKDQNSGTYTKINASGDRAITIERNGLTVIYTEVGQDFVLELTLVFLNDYNKFTINGRSIENDPADCDGTVTGSGIRVGKVGVTIDLNYLQYRTPSNEYRGYFELTKDGIPVVPADINKIELKDSNGASVNLDSVEFSPTTYFYGMWNPATASLDFSGPASYAGFIMHFPGGFNLPADDYTWEVTTSDNKPVSKQINYPGQKVLPFVDSATMSSQRLVDGSLKLSWINPANNPPGDYDQLRVVIRDQNAGEVLYARLPTNVNQMTIPSDWVNIIEDYYSLTNTIWQVQTRSYTVEDMNYARGYSNWVGIPPNVP